MRRWRARVQVALLLLACAALTSSDAQKHLRQKREEVASELQRLLADDGDGDYADYDLTLRDRPQRFDPHAREARDRAAARGEEAAREGARAERSEAEQKVADPLEERLASGAAPRVPSPAARKATPAADEEAALLGILEKLRDPEVDPSEPRGLVELETLGDGNFDQHVNGHKQAMLLFCAEEDPVCPPAVKQFVRLANLVFNDTHLHHRTVVAHVDTALSPALKERFAIKGHPSIRYLGWGKDLNHWGTLALKYDKTGPELHDFLVDHLDDELYIFRTRIMDNFAHEFMFSRSEIGRQRIFQLAKERARELTTDRDRQSARLYLLVMRESNEEEWFTHRGMEAKFYELKARIENEAMDEDARWELEKRLSVISAFVHKFEIDRDRRNHKRREKHIFGNHAAVHWMDVKEKDEL